MIKKLKFYRQIIKSNKKYMYDDEIKKNTNDAKLEIYVTIYGYYAKKLDTLKDNPNRLQEQKLLYNLDLRIRDTIPTNIHLTTAYKDYLKNFQDFVNWIETYNLLDKKRLNSIIEYFNNGSNYFDFCYSNKRCGDLIDILLINRPKYVEKRLVKLLNTKELNIMEG